jgi:DNA-binding transcriptional MerR regulator
MADSESETTYSVGSVARLTGLSPDVLRAWERRYGVVTPLRTHGGTRRYRSTDLERLRLVKAAVDAGHRISEVARLDLSELERWGHPPPTTVPGGPLEEVMEALRRLDGVEADRLIAGQLAALGPTRFAQEFALPLVASLGEAWAGDRICVASEHLGSALMRSLLGTALRPSASLAGAPVVVFATPSGERHELGLLVAALTALGRGASPLYLGADLPASELVRAVEMTGARAIALGIVEVDARTGEKAVAELRCGLSEDVEVWVGGAASSALELPAGVERIESMRQLERRVELLRIRVGAP